MSLKKYKSKIIQNFPITGYTYLKSYCKFYGINQKDFFKNLTDNKLYRHCHYLKLYGIKL